MYRRQTIARVGVCRCSYIQVRKLSWELLKHCQNHFFFICNLCWRTQGNLHAIGKRDRNKIIYRFIFSILPVFIKFFIRRLAHNL